jgi:hypothetical protein
MPATRTATRTVTQEPFILPPSVTTVTLDARDNQRLSQPRHTALNLIF